MWNLARLRLYGVISKDNNIISNLEYLTSIFPNTGRVISASDGGRLLVTEAKRRQDEIHSVGCTSAATLIVDGDPGCLYNGCSQGPASSWVFQCPSTWPLLLPIKRTRKSRYRKDDCAMHWKLYVSAKSADNVIREPKRYRRTDRRTTFCGITSR